MPERIEIDWPHQLEKVAGRLPNPGGAEATVLRAAARAWRAERERARQASQEARHGHVGGGADGSGGGDEDRATGQPGAFSSTRDEGRGE